MQRYTLVKDGKMIKHKVVSKDDKVILPKLLKHGYLRVDEDALPKFDNKTQRLRDYYDIQKNKVIRKWTVYNIPENELPKDLEV